MSGHPPLYRQTSLDRSKLRQRRINYNTIDPKSGRNSELDEIFKQRLEEAYYLRRMREILQDGFQPRPTFPNCMTRLSCHVFIGNQKNADDLDEITSNKITHVINCAPSRLRRALNSDSPYPKETGVVGFLVIPAEDKEDYDIQSHFEETLEFLEEAKHQNGRALVHCNMGINRSGAIIAAYLMASERRNLLEVISFLKSKRSLILTNKGFRRQLINYARFKGLLDPMVEGYERNDFRPEYCRRRGQAFSTPQLRRAIVVGNEKQQTPETTHRSSRSSGEFSNNDLNDYNNNDCFNASKRQITPTANIPNSFTFSKTNGPKMYDSDGSFSKFNSDNEFVVKSLPRNISRMKTEASQNSDFAGKNSASYLRRSMSQLSSEREKDEEYNRGIDPSRIRKSIAYITPTTKYTDETKTVSFREALQSENYPDLNKNKTADNNSNNFSTNIRLTINHPTAVNERNNLNEISKHYLDHLYDTKTNISQQTLPYSQFNPNLESDVSNDVDSRKPVKKVIERNYCRQIKQHFNDFMNMIRPSSTRLPNISQSNFQSPAFVKTKPNDFFITPIYIKKVEIKPMASKQNTRYREDLTHSDATNQFSKPIKSDNSPQFSRYQTTIGPLKTDRFTSHSSSNEYNTGSMPRTYANNFNQSQTKNREKDGRETIIYIPIHHDPPTIPINRSQPYYPTNQELNNNINKLNHRSTAGSLIFIGSRTSNGSIPNNESSIPDQDNLPPSSSVVRKMRPYQRSKTDSDIL